MKITILLALFSLILVNCELERGDFKCDNNLSYKENDCNFCICNQHGQIGACTRMACPSQQDPKNKDCKVGTTWPKDCNTCWCVDSYPYGTVCTQKDEC